MSQAVDELRKKYKSDCGKFERIWFIHDENKTVLSVHLSTYAVNMCGSQILMLNFNIQI